MNEIKPIAPRRVAPKPKLDKSSPEYKQRMKSYALKRVYGITYEQYLQILRRQDHSCFVCGKHEDEFKKSLAVDHNHKTGEIRGLLCFTCNHRVIGRHTNPEVLRRAAEYLETCHTGWFVPVRKRKKRQKHG